MYSYFLHAQSFWISLKKFKFIFEDEKKTAPQGVTPTLRQNNVKLLILDCFHPSQQTREDNKLAVKYFLIVTDRSSMDVDKR